MSVAAGGKIKQVIAPDRYPKGWEGSKTIVFNVQILNSAIYRAITGVIPPTKPLSAAIYKQYGLPFFKLYEEPSGVSGDFSLVKSVGEIDGVQDKKVEPMVVGISNSAGMFNLNGPLREFRTVADLQKEFEDYYVVDF